MKKIPLTKGFVALVDDEDYARVSQYKWCALTPGSLLRSPWRRSKGRVQSFWELC